MTLFYFAGAPALAQDQEPAETSSSSQASSKIEKIKVTGSHIKRTDVEGPSPVMTLDREFLDRSGYNSVGEVLRDLPAASLGGNRENSLNGGARAGTQTTSLRGFGSSSILVLLDGRRLPAIGGTSEVDLNLIPAGAIEKVEILMDGASAIYGSDALGGVINFITKRDYDGVEVQVGTTVPFEKGGTRYDTSVSYGKSGARYNFLGVYQYRGTQPAWSRDRNFTRVNGNIDALSPFGSPGTYVNLDASGQSVGGPQTSVAGGTQCPSNQIKANGFCGFDYSEFSQIMPNLNQHAVLLNGSYDINESLKVYGRALYTYRDVDSELAPPPDSFEDESDTGGVDHRLPGGLWPGVGDGSSPAMAVFYRMVDELGNRRNETISHAYSFQTGVQYSFLNTWDMDFGLNYAANKSTNTGVSGYANKQFIFEQLVDPATFTPRNPNYFNPFSTTKSDISDAIYQPERTVDSEVFGANLLSSGELFDFGQGVVALALGGAAQWMNYEEGNDPITTQGFQWGGGTIGSGSGERNFQSLFAELSATPLRMLELQLAARFDHYSDFGRTFNPRVALRFKPIERLLFRASFGTGFRAPTLENLYAARSVGFPFGVDLTKDEGNQEQFELTESGNRNLREETSRSLNVGFVAEPERGISFSVDYYRTQQENVVARASIRDIFLAEERLGQDFLERFGVFVLRTEGLRTRIVAPVVNRASFFVSGLDSSLTIRKPLYRGVNIDFGVMNSVLFDYELEPFPGLGVEERVGFAGIPYWRTQVAGGISTSTHSVSLIARGIGEQDASFGNPGTGKTRDHWELDLRLGYNAPWGGRFFGGVRNILGTARPWQREYRSAGFVNSDLYDVIGRSFHFNYAHQF